MLTTLINTIRGYIARAFNREPETIRHRTVRKLYEAISDYSEWYDEHGLYLPPDFHDRPADWSEELHKMVRAFELLYDEMNSEGDLWEAKHKWNSISDIDKKRIDDLEKEIRDGFASFGLQLYYLNDPKRRNQ